MPTKLGVMAFLAKLLHLPKSLKIVLGIVLLSLLGFGAYRLFFVKKSAVTYETSKAEKGTLISSVSSTGTITAGNNSSIVTKVSGTVSNVYVNNGDKVSKGQKIASVTLDDYAADRQASAWADYLTASEAYKQAVADKSTSDIDMWNARQKVLDAQQALDDMNDDNTNPKTHEAYTDGEKQVIIKTLDQTRKLFTVSETKFLDADAKINAAAANVTAALRDYEQNSATIVAPAAGTISDLVLAPGSVVAASSTTSNTTGSTIVSAQTVGKVKSDASQLMASVSVTEVDVPKIKAGQKATLTLDAFSGKTFTGKVLAVNTSGSVSSGVTSYPVTILLDPVSGVEIYPNMAVTADIITDLKTDVVNIPTTAIQASADGTSYVQVMKNGKPTRVTVTTGMSNDSNTEITSGLSEGDEVVTSTITAAASKTSSTSATSPFSGLTGRSGSSSSSRSTSGTRTFIQMGGPGGF